MEQNIARFAAQQKMQEAQMAFQREQAAGQMQEAAAWADDAKVLAPYQNAWAGWMNNPDAQMPMPPQVKSRQGQAVVNQLLTQGSQYGARARMAKELDEQSKIATKILTDEIASDRKLMEISGVDFRMPTQSNPKGYEVDQVKFQQALDASKRNQLLRSTGAGEMAAIGDEDMASAFGIPVDQVPALRERMGGVGGTIKFDRIPAAKAVVEQIKASGIPLTPEEEADAIAKYAVGGNAMNAPAPIAKDLQTEVKSFKLLDDSIAKIEAFNQKYGKDAFSKFVGPIDSLVVEKFASTFPASVRESAISDAKNIFEGIEKVVQGYRLGNFGTALTESETQRFLRILRDPSAADYERSIRNFRNNAGESIAATINPYKIAPNIPLDTKRRFLGGAPEKIETYPGEFQGRAQPQGQTNQVRVIRFDAQGNRIQ